MPVAHLLQVRISDKHKAWIDSQTDELFKTPDLIRGLIDDKMGIRVLPLRRLDTAPTIAAYPVRCGTHNGETQPVLGSEPAVISSDENFSPDSELSFGDGVGKESEETPRKPVLRQVPDHLAQHHELIDEFWKKKKGSKSDTAWKLLLTELTKIQEAFDDQRLEEQLQLGINGLWQSITLRNLERFERGNKAPQKPEPKHPASRVFTAADGFTEAW